MKMYSYTQPQRGTEYEKGPHLVIFHVGRALSNEVIVTKKSMSLEN